MLLERKIYFLVAIWIVYAVIMTALMSFVHPPYMRDFSVLNELKWELSFSIVGIAATPVITILSRRFSLLGNKKLKNGIVLLLFGIAFSLLLSIGHALVVYLLHSGARALDKNLFTTSLFYNIDKFIIVYFVIVILQHAIMYYRQVKEKEIRESQLQTQLAQAQMQALKMQLQPHFLFNTLNAIVTLIHKDPELAEEMIVRLSNFLRLTLEASGKQTVSLKEELSFVNAYLDIERVRFEERMEYKENVPAELLDADVPVLLLQPIVENVVKHSLSKYSSANLLEVSAQQSNSTLIISVKDNGAPAEIVKNFSEKEGVGLANTRNRLRTLYGTSFSLTVSPNVPRGCAVAVSFPLKWIHDNERSDS